MSDDFFSPTPSAVSNRVIDLIAVCRRWPIADAGATMAFMHADEREVVYAQPPNGWRREGWVWRRCQNNNGSRTGEAAWMDNFTKAMQGI